MESAGDSPALSEKTALRHTIGANAACRVCSNSLRRPTSATGSGDVDFPTSAPGKPTHIKNRMIDQSRFASLFYHICLSAVFSESADRNRRVGYHDETKSFLAYVSRIGSGIDGIQRLGGGEAGFFRKTFLCRASVSSREDVWQDLLRNSGRWLLSAHILRRLPVQPFTTIPGRNSIPIPEPSAEPGRHGRCLRHRS